MATSTRQARREAIEKRERYAQNYHNLFASLFDNSIVVEGSDVPKRYLFRILREKGGIAYDKETALFLPYNEKGKDVYGLPLGYTLVGYDGFVIDRKPEEVVILRANDLKFALQDYFDEQINKIVDIDLAIEQNIDSCKTMTIAEVSDEASLLSLGNEYQAKRMGATVVFKNKNAMAGTELKVSSTGATYLADKLLEARKEVLNETLSTIGISVANTDKRERVQQVEVLASQGYALDCINTLIDTFNYDAKVGGLPIRLRGNTSLIEEHKIELMNKENVNNE